MTLWDWLNQITYEKKSWSSFTEDQQSSFNPYMVHRFVSMYSGYIDIANTAQKLPLTNKEQIYTIYATMLPKKKIFLKLQLPVSKLQLPVLNPQFPMMKIIILSQRIL
jgi:hypothetical protein